MCRRFSTFNEGFFLEIHTPRDRIAEVSLGQTRGRKWNPASLPPCLLTLQVLTSEFHVLLSSPNDGKILPENHNLMDFYGFPSNFTHAATHSNPISIFTLPGKMSEIFFGIATSKIAKREFCSNEKSTRKKPGDPRPLDSYFLLGFFVWPRTGNSPRTPKFHFSHVSFMFLRLLCAVSLRSHTGSSFSYIRRPLAIFSCREMMPIKQYNVLQRSMLYQWLISFINQSYLSHLEAKKFIFRVAIQNTSGEETTTDCISMPFALISPSCLLNFHHIGVGLCTGYPFQETLLHCDAFQLSFTQMKYNEICQESSTNLQHPVKNFFGVENFNMSHLERTGWIKCCSWDLAMCHNSGAFPHNSMKDKMGKLRNPDTWEVRWRFILIGRRPKAWNLSRVMIVMTKDCREIKAIPGTFTDLKDVWSEERHLHHGDVQRKTDVCDGGNWLLRCGTFLVEKT